MRRHFFHLALVLAACLSAPAASWAQTRASTVSYSTALGDVYQRLEALESAQKGDDEYYGKGESCGPNYGILETDGCAGWLVRLDYLYWTVRNAQTEYAITDIGGVQDRGAVGQALVMTPDLNGGYRIAAGRRFGDCCNGGREFLLRMTDFDRSTTQTAGPVRSTFISADNSENNDSDDINTLGVETITPDDRATSVSATYDFSYNVYDFEIAQRLILSEELSMRFSATGRYMDMSQRFQVTYTGGDFQTPLTSFETNDVDGAGVLAGTEMNWYLRNGFTLDVGARVGAIFGNVTTRTFIPDDETMGNPTDVTYSQHRLIPVMELNAGVTYRRHFGNFLLTSGFGVEATQLFNVYDHRTFTDSHQEGMNVNTIGDISLDGLYWRFGLDY